MASLFKNAGMAVGLADTSAANLYTAGGAQTAVIHAVYITCLLYTSDAADE